MKDKQAKPERLQAIRGMSDILPDAVAAWQHMETQFVTTVDEFGYREIRLPIVERTGLFERSIGDGTDIVSKEMYTFTDRNGDSLTLRPEGTAGCVRAAEEHGLLYHQQQRMWYDGPMFRHERPQKGRYRQFNQFGVEAFGMAGPDIDAEVIELAHAFFKRLQLDTKLELQINNIGSAADREMFSEMLGAHFATQAGALDPETMQTVFLRPWRLLDSKDPKVRKLLRGAPKLSAFVSKESKEHYRELLDLLDKAHVPYRENPHLVRGLDYYNNCVFEFTTDALGAQDAVCGGGRYDGLVEQLGGQPTPAVGFALGKERVVLLLEKFGRVPEKLRRMIDVYIVSAGEGLAAEALALAHTLRGLHPRRGVVCHCGGGKASIQIKKAHALGARLVMILEPDEPGSQVVSRLKVRELKDGGATLVLPIEGWAEEVGELLHALP